MTYSNRNITRIDIDREGQTGTHGWEVRINRRGQKISKFFSDSLYGGKRATLKVARDYRDEIEEQIPQLSRVEVLKNTSARTDSGIAGVRRRTNTVVRNGWEYSYDAWEASWTPKIGGRRMKRLFSVLKHGDDKAFQLAVQARKEALKDIISKEESAA
jgi:hypothetical protein